MSVIRHSIRDQVRESLLRRIGSGELSPGTRLRENTLAKELGVSPIPVREAIRELVVMGVLDSQSHCGAWVREVSLSETIEALQVRSGLDAQAARLAANTLRGKCQPLREIVEDLMVSAQQSDFVQFQEHNQAFHRLIVESSGNGVLLRIWDSLGFEVRTRAVMGYLSSCDPVGIAAEHEAIVDALDTGDGELAAQLLSTHSLGLVQRLEEQQGEEKGTPQQELAKST